eukprot:TRINITY_DN1986_c0_g1_i1.p1 TRINITY_DN1986_c0_g1~~TRINITY_DN1986_c0_g1_i1.p1  ORF type:complete len:328 (+),score=61.81 TRINITY_DN1986_c0_g1_i1:42-1025(+)
MHSHFNKGLQVLQTIEKSHPLVTRVMGHNPGKFTLQGSNTYLVGCGKERILIDTGEGREEYLGSLRTGLEGATIRRVIITHWHPDHVGGLPSLLKSDLLSKDFTVHKMTEANHDERVFKDLQLDRSIINPIKSGDVFSVDSATLHAIHTPGHTTDHCCLYLENEPALFTGDVVLGQGSSHFSNLVDYLKSLELLKQFSVKKTDSKCTIYPSHGPVIEDGTSKIEEYIAHRLKRDEQILEVLKDRTMKAAEIVDLLYQDVPKEMHKAAETNVVLHLLRLEAINLVTGTRAESINQLSLGGGVPAELLDIFDLVAPNITATWSRKQSGL